MRPGRVPRYRPARVDLLTAAVTLPEIDPEPTSALVLAAGIPTCGGRMAPTRRLAGDGYLVVPSDRIHKATVEALVPGAIRPISSEELEEHGLPRDGSFWGAYPFSTGKENNRLRGVIGFRREPDARVRDMLKRNPALVVKAHYALWARLYTETDAAPDATVAISLSRFCDDLGYYRLPNGAHRPARKREASTALRLLTDLELWALYTPPLGSTRHIEGPIWVHGDLGHLRDGFADLFDTGNDRDVLGSRPLAFAYAPGPWFSDPIWRRCNATVALVGEGILRLRSSDNDKWAILVGGCLAPLARMNGYTPRVLRVQRLLERSGLLRADPRNPGRALDKLERALDRLCEVSVIRDWRYTRVDPREPDMDSPRDLAALSECLERTQQRSLLVRWPAPLEERAQRLRPSHPPRRARRKEA